ncbi:MAG: carboxypeptidase regulatory-like domain-containing protein [Bryobacterales bacterium]|nr:carboxypeptidase regulatory-like domain-containing protein [Bryobacterales bacterium]
MRRLALTLALLTILAGTLFAQLDRGSLSGIVTDPSGASVANAQITATHLDTNTTFSTRSSD